MIKHGPQPRHITLKESRTRDTARAKAALNCDIYIPCLDKYSLIGKTMPCYKCGKKMIEDSYRKELHHNYLNVDVDKLPLRIPR